MKTSDPAELLALTAIAIWRSFSHWDEHLGLDPVMREPVISRPRESTHQHSEPWHWTSWYRPSSVHWGTCEVEVEVTDLQTSDFWKMARNSWPNWVLSSAFNCLIASRRVVRNCSFSRAIETSLIISRLFFRFTERPNASDISWSRLKLAESPVKVLANSIKSVAACVKPTWLKTWLKLNVPLFPTVPVKLKFPAFFRNFPPKRFSLSLLGFGARARAFRARAPEGNIPWRTSARMSPTFGRSSSGNDWRRPELAKSSWNSGLQVPRKERVSLEMENTLLFLKSPAGP